MVIAGEPDPAGELRLTAAFPDDRDDGRAPRGSRPNRSGGDDVTPTEAFGAQLRRERERAGISLDAIARKINVASMHFVALERGDCAGWPPPVYSRAFIRGYARAIGLHPEQVLAEAEQLFPKFFEGSANIITPRPRGDQRHELRLQLDAIGTQYSNLARRLTVLVIDGGIALAAGLGGAWMGQSVWTGVAVVLAFCYLVTILRSPGQPRSAFLLARSLPPPRRAPLPLEAAREPFPEEALNPEPSAPA